MGSKAASSESFVSPHQHSQNAKDQHMFAQVHMPSLEESSNVIVVLSVHIIRSYKTIIAILVIIQLLMTSIEYAAKQNSLANR